MKPRLLIAILVSISSTLSFSSYAAASPTGIHITIKCPSTKGIQNVLANFGDYVAGYGEEIIQQHGQTPVYFKSNVIPDGLPSQLTAYENKGTSYESATGLVTCQYASPNKRTCF